MIFFRRFLNDFIFFDFLSAAGKKSEKINVYEIIEKNPFKKYLI